MKLYAVVDAYGYPLITMVRHTKEEVLQAVRERHGGEIPAGCRVIEFDDGSNALGDLIMSALPGPTVSPLRLVVGKSVIERQVYP
jgi:hypothetical protein